MPPNGTTSSAHLDGIVHAQVSRTTAPTGCRSRARRRDGPDRRHRRLGRRRAVRARRRRGRRARLVHHGLLWGGPPRPLDRARRAPAAAAARRTTSRLAAYHLPLDAPPGARQQRAARRGRSGATLGAPFAAARGPSRSAWPRASPAPIAAGRAVRARARADRPRAAGLPRRPATRCARSAIVSGAGADHLADAIAAGPRRLPHRRARRARHGAAREGGVHFLAAGHYATETFGVPAPRRARSPSASASATCSSTSRTRSEADRRSSALQRSSASGARTIRAATSPTTPGGSARWQIT